MQRFRGSRNLPASILMFLMLAPAFATAALTSGTEPQQGRIIHTPVTSLRENGNLVLEARMDGVATRVIYMRVYYKSQYEDSFRYVEMSPAGAGFLVELSRSQISTGVLQYFILALVGSQEVVTYPALNPYGNPVEVTLAAGRPGSPPRPRVTPSPPPTEAVPAEQFVEDDDITPLSELDLDDDSPMLVLSPENGEEFGAGEEVLVAVSFVAADSDPVDVSSVTVFVDGVNTTLEAEVTENLLTYTESHPDPGTHQVQVQGFYQSGAELPTLVWFFKVKEKRQRQGVSPAFQGRVFAESRHENISDTGFNDNNLGGHLSGNYGIASYDARIYLTTREDKQFQPRNRFTFNLELPVVGLTFGDIYPRFNDLMLWGKRVRGLHGRVHLGFFNVDLVTGETVRNVGAIKTVVLDSLGQAVLNTAGQDSTDITFGTYGQDLLGLRASFGGGRRFQWGLNLLKVRDDSTSLALGDGSTTPQDNLVVGSDLMFAFANHRVEFRAAAALSWLTTDITGGPLSRSQIEDQFEVELPDFLDPAKIDQFLIFNSSTTPIDPRDLTSLAYNLSLRVNLLNNNVQVGYKSLGSEYNSLGNSFLRNNLRGFFIQDRLRVYQNKLYLNLGFENYDDNFNGDEQDPATDLQTVTTGFSIFPGPGLPNLSFNLRSHARDNGISTQRVDTLVVDEVTGVPTVLDTVDNRENNNTRDLSVQLNYDTRFLNLSHSISLSYINSNRDDQFVPLTENSSNVQVISVRSVYPFPLVTTINFVRNDNEFAAGLNTFNFKMFGAKAEYRWLNNRLNTYFATNLTSASGVSSSDSSTVSSVTDYNRIAINAGARFQISPGQFVLLDGSLIRFNDNGFTVDAATGLQVVNPSFSDRILRLYYEKRF